MKTKFLSIILALFIVQPCVCFADTSSSYSNSGSFSDFIESDFIEFEYPSNFDFKNGTIKSSMNDVKLLLEKNLTLTQNNKFNDVLNNCELKNEGDKYNLGNLAMVSIVCDKDDNIFKALVETPTDEDIIESEDGGLGFFIAGTNQKFNVSLKSQTDTKCLLSVLGFGANDTQVEGLPMSLTCEKSNDVSSGTHLNIAKTLVGAVLAMFTLF